ncbi:hypothetical protein EKO23_08320 [Nocardioides guangzhouensis]|uniref:DUF4064 domain-containing protein n=1 Tax=Nocardioides guangzhouensis TaxID=2497878 RepID=A0A4Q4ZF10_9ACTN|nr:hypothetical protein [Nocardioides guangzhouensis]RYP86667.1 hypothetical protein EKO23_08320 [Nocardioides guangzhouensis]
MSDTAPNRPPQVTMAGWVTILGSAAVVLTVFDLVANLRSIDTRERVQKALSEPPLDGTGIGLQTVLSIMHVTAMVAAGCATAAIVLGWHVLRRNKAARTALTVLAVPLFLAGLVTGGFMSSMVAVAVIMLWTRTARDWFDGRPAAQAGGPFGGPPGGDGRADREADPDTAPHPFRTPPPPASEPPPFSGFGTPGGESGSAQAPEAPTQPPGQPPGQQPGQQPGQPPMGPSQPWGQQPWGQQPMGPSQPWGQQPWGQPPGAPDQPPWQQPPVPSQAWPAQHPWPGTAAPYAPARPREVLTAAVLTWLCTGVVAFAMLLVVGGFLLDPSIVDEMYSSDDRFADSGLTVDQLRTWSLALAAVFGAWSLAAAGLALIAFLGHGWARVLLIASAVVTALLTLLMVVAAPVVLLLTLPTVATVVLLTRPPVNAWFAHRASQRSGRGA